MTSSHCRSAGISRAFNSFHKRVLYRAVVKQVVDHLCVEELAIGGGDEDDPPKSPSLGMGCGSSFRCFHLDAMVELIGVGVRGLRRKRAPTRGLAISSRTRP